MIVAAVALAGCGGGAKKQDGPTPKGTQTADRTPSPSPTPNPNERVRWPRYWATRDGAETGASTNYNTAFYAGYDDTAVVYNGEDVVRVLKRRTGKPIGRVVLPSGRYVCGSSPRREVDAHIAVFGVGSLAATDATCDQVMGVSTRTGKRRWVYGKRGRDVDDPVIDSRDGRVLYAEDKLVTVLGARTGKRLWRRSAVQVQGSRTAKDDFCRMGTALAADRPVVIVYMESCGRPFMRAKIVGLDFATGKKLWEARDPRDPDQFDPYFVHPHVLDGRYLGGIQDGDRRKRPTEAAFVESKTGRTTQYETPNPMRFGDTDPNYAQCSDVANEDGLTYDDETCAFMVGPRVLYVQPSLTRKKQGVTILATDVVTGRRFWTFQRGGEVRVMGANAAGTEFWLATNKREVMRLDVATGKVIARGRLAPPLELPRMQVAGPELLLVRGTPGISNVKSGMDFYVTDAG